MEVSATCPFCGGKASVHKESRWLRSEGYYVECTGCYARGPLTATCYECVALWNRQVVVKQYTLKPFEPVLVRDSEGGTWTCDFFVKVMYDEDDGQLEYDCVGNVWGYCIPYSGYESYFGKTDTPPDIRILNKPVPTE